MKTILLCLSVLLGLTMLSAPALADMRATDAHACCGAPLRGAGVTVNTMAPPASPLALAQVRVLARTRARTKQVRPLALVTAVPGAEGPLVNSKLDPELLSKAVYAVLRYDSDKRTYEEVAPLIRGVIRAADAAGIDPVLAVTVPFVESRFRAEAVGDGGNACGMGQQHARFSMDWATSPTPGMFKDTPNEHARKVKRIRHECGLLASADGVYATKVLIQNLSGINKRTRGELEKYVWWYNGYANPWMSTFTTWRRLIDGTYGRLVEAERLKATPVQTEGS